MEIKVIEEGKKRLVFQIDGESHTLCNAIKDELNNDKNVSVASYYISHPDIDIPTFIIEMKTGEPKKALLNAITRLKKLNDKFLATFVKEVK